MTVNSWGGIGSWPGGGGSINSWGPINSWGATEFPSFEIALQTAVYDALSILGYPVYDDVPQPDDCGDSTQFPYIVVGDDAFTMWDTDTENGMNVLFTVHSWSRTKGKKEIKEIQGKVYNLIQNSRFYHNGYHFLQNKFVSSDTFNDIDGETHHGVSIFKVYFERL